MRNGNNACLRFAQWQEEETSLDRSDPLAHQTQNPAIRGWRWEGVDFYWWWTRWVSTPDHSGQIHQWHELWSQWPQARHCNLQSGGESRLTAEQWDSSLCCSKSASFLLMWSLNEEISPPFPFLLSFPQLRKCFDTPLVHISPVDVWSADHDALLNYTIKEDFMSSTWDWIGLYKVLGQTKQQQQQQQ